MAHRQVLTVRFPEGFVARLRAVRSGAESLNDLVVEATEREVQRREGVQADAAIRRLREEIFETMGPQPDSTPVIRGLRGGIGRHD